MSHDDVMVGDHEATGERFIPELMGGGLLEAEHRARYRLALPHVRGRRVLDAGCGVGWGSQLLLDAGAAVVFGVDIDPGAVADARRRSEGGGFAMADLLALPVADQSIDVVVCFEVLEHVADHAAVLDAFARVLRPDGLLFVSSPNPDVYPAGNPFHILELRPDDLHAAVGERFTHTRLFRQRVALSSHISDGAPGTTARSFQVPGWAIDGCHAGHDPYSLVVAGAAALPVIEGVQVLAPSDQLDNLDAAAAAVASDRQALEEQHAAVASERQEILTALDDAHARLRAADAALRSLSDERDRLVAGASGAAAPAGERAAELERAQVALARTTAERDRLGADLVAVEQALARRPSPLIAAPAQADPEELEALAGEAAALHARLDAAEQRHSSAASEVAARDRELAMLRTELRAIRDTVSWRLTAPLRSIRRRLPR